MQKVEWHLISLPEVEGKVRKVRAGGSMVCVVRLGDRVYATSSRCPHAGADLSQGWCEDGKLVCPYHRHKFDLHTGRGDDGQSNFIYSYPVKEVDGRWYVGFKKSWWSRLWGS